MLQLKNETPFKASILLLPDRAGVDTLVTVVKATFALGAELAPAEEQAAVVLADEHHGDPTTSSIRAPSDVCLEKPGTDVLLVGSAWAPRGQPAHWMDVSLTVGPVSKTVRVFGDRVWDAGPAGAVPTPPRAFTRLPLVWERAYGGTDLTDKGPTTDARNPVGLGFRSSQSQKPLAGLPLPNLEDPASLIASWKDRPTPACFGPVAPHWEPRPRYAGTYDEAWQRDRAPYLPVDFDPRFFQVAASGLVAPGHLVGGEFVDVRGATASGWLQFTLPVVRLRIAYRLPSSEQERQAVLDTVIIDPDLGRLVMVWRSALTCDKTALKVREVRANLLEAA